MAISHPLHLFMLLLAETVCSVAFAGYTVHRVWQDDSSRARMDRRRRRKEEDGTENILLKIGNRNNMPLKFIQQSDNVVDGWRLAVVKKNDVEKLWGGGG